MNTTNNERVVAAFDFDGTLSTRDNVVPFLHRVAGTRGTLRAATTSAVRVATNPRATHSRRSLQGGVVQRVFAGRDARSVDALARDFAADIVQRHLRAEAVARTEWHREQGHRVVIVSASFGAYLRPIAQQLGLGVAATGLEADAR